MKRLLAFLAVLGWLLIIYWGLPPSLLPGSSVGELQGGPKAPGFDTDPLRIETVEERSRTLLD